MNSMITSPLSSSSFFFLLLLIPSSVPFPLPLSPTPPPPTIYDLLPKFGLPPGLLPDTVTSYALTPEGSFVVDLAGPCYIQFDSYLVYYEPRITGTLKIGGIRDLQGIEVRKFFLWIDVDEIKVDLPPSDYIYFEVGWITKKLLVQEFMTVHSCRDSLSLLPLLQGMDGTKEEIPMLLTE